MERGEPALSDRTDLPPGPRARGRPDRGGRTSPRSRKRPGEAPGCTTPRWPDPGTEKAPTSQASPGGPGARRGRDLPVRSRPLDGRPRPRKRRKRSPEATQPLERGGEQPPYHVIAGSSRRGAPRSLLRGSRWRHLRGRTRLRAQGTAPPAARNRPPLPPDRRDGWRGGGRPRGAPPRAPREPEGRG